MNPYTLAKGIEQEVIAWRRDLHERAELGFHLPKTAAYVREKLESFGYEVEELYEHALVTSVGKGEKCLLLRADMDALPIQEESGEPFAAKENGHACGHDIHTAMLLGTAKVLKEHEAKLKSTIKIMFQPAEELLQGAEKMIEHGLMENPRPDAGIMLHMDSLAPVGLYLKTGTMTTFNNNFRIKVRGRGAHGAMPEKGIDTIVAGSHIVLALQELVSREIGLTNAAVLTVCHFAAGNSPNTIAQEALLEGTMRTYSRASRDHLNKRMPEITKAIAESFRCTAEFEYTSDVPSLYNNEDFVKNLSERLEAVAEGNFVFAKAEPVTATDDFGFVGEQVPVIMMMVGAKVEDGEAYPLHNSKVRFNEDAIVPGVTAQLAAAFAMPELLDW